MDLNRFKNYGLWVAIIALIPMILKGFGVDILPQNYNEITTAILSILVMAGIINNPTTENKWFKDDKIGESTNSKEEAIGNADEEKNEMVQAPKSPEHLGEDENNNGKVSYYNNYDEITRKTIEQENNEVK